jgi:hypothetical protein
MEAYSNTMLLKVRQDVQQSSIGRLRELLLYYRKRNGPGLALVKAEITARWARRALNYPPNSNG